MATPKKRIGLAFQGGGFPAGAIGAGVVRYLVENKAFEHNDVVAFSGTSAGALVATVCWGHMLSGTIDQAPDVLEKQWLHNAYGTIPNAMVAQAAKITSTLAHYNPLYTYTTDKIGIPIIRRLFKEWVKAYIPIEEWISKRNSSDAVPGLALGAADILRGAIKVFTEKDLSLDALLASGSLDEINGITEILEGEHAGTYCDGAWGTNPPIKHMVDLGIDELWLVEVFPKCRATVPMTPAERADRKDELWQNSLVEHEIYVIERVNQWLREGQLDGEKYREITIKKMPMTRDLPAGAAYINSKSFIKEMMNYGYLGACQLWNCRDIQTGPAVKAGPGTSGA